MLKSFSMLVFAIAYIGCSSTYIVSSSPHTDRISFPEFNAAAENENAKIVFQDDSTLDVQSVRAEADSISWLHPRTRARVRVPTSNIRKIILKNAALGGLEGAGLGLLAGGGAGLIVGAISAGSKNYGYHDNLAKVGLIVTSTIIGTGVGFLSGTIAGALLGHTYEYEFFREAKNP